MHDKDRLYAGALLAAVLVGLGLLLRGHPPAATESSKPPILVHPALSAAIKPPVTVSGPSIGKTGNDTSTIEVCGIGKVTLAGSTALAGRLTGQR